MCTIMKTKQKNNAHIFDLKTYKLPNLGSSNADKNRSFNPFPKTDFDIYDFKMIFNDEATKKLIREGRTIGCFYIESPGMRQLLRKLNCDTFEMLTAASSVIRPGVAESGMMQEFVARHKDPSKRKYLIPEMEKVLGETYGVMIYQEDVIKVANQIAGLSLEEADLLRRAMSGKMRSHSAMLNIKEKFFTSCRDKKLTDKIAKELWRQIESFAGYAFCKAHSASFALLSFQVAYLKVHYPAEFMASVLSNMGGYYSTAVYIQECKRAGLKVYLPSINESKYEYFGEKNYVRIGLMAVKTISEKLVRDLLKEREKNGRFVSLPDFIVRLQSTYEDTATLIKCGAMDFFNITRPSLLRLLDVYFHHRKILDEDYTTLFESDTYRLEQEVITKKDYTSAEKCVHEYEIFGFMVSNHPLDFYSEFINHPKITKAVEMPEHHGEYVNMIGWYMASKRIKTKTNEIMKFLSLEDLTGNFEAVIFPRTYRKYAELTLSMGPYLLYGKVDAEDSFNIIVEKMKVLSAREVKSVTIKDSSENKFYGEVEKVSEEDFRLVEMLNKRKMHYAYVS